MEKMSQYAYYKDRIVTTTKAVLLHEKLEA